MSGTLIDESIRRIKIDTTDIFLENLGPGRGKIIIADPYGGSYSYFWGSMGKTIEEFILGMDFGYFHKNVNPHDDGDFNGKKTVRNIRKTLREDFSYDLPWYEHMEAQKELREKLRELEQCENDYEFVDCAGSLAGNLDLFDIDSTFDRNNFRESVGRLMDEPWYYIEKGPSRNTLFLTALFPKLKNAIKKELKKK